MIYSDEFQRAYDLIHKLHNQHPAARVMADFGLLGDDIEIDLFLHSVFTIRIGSGGYHVMFTPHNPLDNEYEDFESQDSLLRWLKNEIG